MMKRLGIERPVRRAESVEAGRTLGEVAAGVSKHPRLPRES
jgi:hypothetical protein